MTTPAKLYGKDLSEYDDVDVDALLAQLSPEEINILAKEVDPDVSSLMIQLKEIIVQRSVTSESEKRAVPTIIHSKCQRS